MSALLPGEFAKDLIHPRKSILPNARRRVLLDCWSDSLLFGAWREVVIPLPPAQSSANSRHFGRFVMSSAEPEAQRVLSRKK
jgi:hypothetical protein